MDFEPIDWSKVLTLETSPLEMIARGALLYVAIMLILRLLPRRAGNQLAAMDLVFLLLLTEAASHSLGDFTSIGDGLIMILTLVAFDYGINALSYHVPWLEPILLHSKIEVVRDGKLLRREMRREFLTEEELMASVRAEGLDDLSKVRRAVVEADGRITVVPRD